MSFYEVPTRSRSRRRSGVVGVVAVAALMVVGVGTFIGFRDPLPGLPGSSPPAVAADPASAHAWLFAPEDEQLLPAAPRARAAGFRSSSIRHRS